MRRSPNRKVRALLTGAQLAYLDKLIEERSKVLDNMAGSPAVLAEVEILGDIHDALGRADENANKN